MVWYNPTTWGNTVEPQPIQVNPGNAGMLARHVGRLANLYSAQKRSNTVAIQHEIRQRLLAISTYGHSGPQTEEEARELLTKVKGN